MAFLVKAGGEHLEVAAITHRWYEHDGGIFVQVELTDNRLTVLRYDPARDTWVVVLMPVRRYDKQHKPSSRRGDPTWPARAREQVRTEEEDE